MHDEGYDWERFWIHFIFGALVGAIMGLVFWARYWHHGSSAALCVGGFFLVVALLGGIWGDRFWEWFLESFRWMWWR